jgi:hypothetical protein
VLGCFLVFFTTAMLQPLVRCTNLYAAACYEAEAATAWEPVTEQELLSFIGVHLAMGISQLPEYDMWGGSVHAGLLCPMGLVDRFSAPPSHAGPMRFAASRADRRTCVVSKAKNFDGCEGCQQFMCAVDCFKQWHTAPPRRAPPCPVGGGSSEVPWPYPFL